MRRSLDILDPLISYPIPLSIDTDFGVWDNKCDMSLPKYFKSILWFADFDRVSIKKDQDMILFQALEKGRMEHLKYLAHKLGGRTLIEFARKNAKRFSRKSIPDFITIVFSRS